ncbi:MAG: ubiquinol-cytochrome C chaperone family protein [Rhizobiaceae bacterium]
MFKSLFGSTTRTNQAIAAAVYSEIVAAARQPAYYSRLNVPDTPLGRYEMLSLHVFLFLRRMKDETGAAAHLAQEVTDMFFEDLDHSLRELGIGDIGVPKRMKKLSKMFYGRVVAYGEALDAADRTALASALARNVQPELDEWPSAPELAEIIENQAEHLQNQDLSTILSGKLKYMPSPESAA